MPDHVVMKTTSVLDDILKDPSDDEEGDAAAVVENSGGRGGKGLLELPTISS